MVARFGVPGTTAVPVKGGPSAASVAAARRALACDPLASYLHAVTAPLTLSRFVSDIGAAFGYTTMSFSAVPSLAAAQLCHTGTAGHR